MAIGYLCTKTLFDIMSILYDERSLREAEDHNP